MAALRISQFSREADGRGEGGGRGEVWGQEMYMRKHMEEKNDTNEEIISHSNHINLILKSLKFPILFYSDSEFFLTVK